MERITEFAAVHESDVGTSLQRPSQEFMSAFGGSPDLRQSSALIVKDVNDPLLPFGNRFCCDAQQRSRATVWYIGREGPSWMLTAGARLAACPATDE
jgi:hypothetical protein